MAAAAAATARRSLRCSTGSHRSRCGHRMVARRSLSCSSRQRRYRRRRCGTCPSVHPCGIAHLRLSRGTQSTFILSSHRVSVTWAREERASRAAVRNRGGGRSGGAHGSGCCGFGARPSSRRPTAAAARERVVPSFPCNYDGRLPKRANFLRCTLAGCEPLHVPAAVLLRTVSHVATLVSRRRAAVRAHHLQNQLPSLASRA